MAGKKGMTIKKSHEDSPRFAEYYKKEHTEWTVEQCEEEAKNKRDEEIWEYDNIKIQTAKYQGYDILTIWETDYHNDKDATLQKCIDFLS